VKVSVRLLVSVSLLLFTLFIMAGCSESPPATTPDNTSNKPSVTNEKSKPEQQTVTKDQANREQPAVNENKSKPDQKSGTENKVTQEQSNVQMAPAFSLNVLGGTGKAMQIPADIKGSKTALVFFSLT